MEYYSALKPRFLPTYDKLARHEKYNESVTNRQILHEILTVAKFIETESRTLVARLGVGDMETGI